MSYEAELAAIEKRFSTMWGVTTPVAYSNVAFTTDGKAEWVRINVLPGSSEEASIGTPDARLDRYTGVIVVGIFVALNAGEKRARQLAELACSIFRGASFEGIETWAPYMNVVGEAGTYYQVNVTVNYKRDQIN